LSVSSHTFLADESDRLREKFDRPAVPHVPVESGFGTDCKEVGTKYQTEEGTRADGKEAAQNHE